MGKKEAAKSTAPAQHLQPRCNIDAPNASSGSEQLLAWSCYNMMVASRVSDDCCACKETVAFECVQNGDTEMYRRLDSCDADDNAISLEFCQMNSCRPGNHGDIPCAQLFQECGASPLNSHQLLYVPWCSR